ncbi:hypothetical protein CC78DRAFT_221291 [Lojkania enalia]|uniref:SprT-like domain-containing protein n=1 Tax=Lojkania enalia TaxID=147567 RepID=A0A9P4K8R3_9PLEO|nr:hypothetical protein CC78DRAFT_221291 [Didymosphaeria enalia]
MTYINSLVPFRDRTTVGFPHSPYSSDPDLYRRQSTFEQPSSNNAVSRLRNERARCDRNLGWNLDFATAFLVDHLDAGNSPDAAKTLRAIRSRAQESFNGGRLQELPYLVFNALDEILFANHLKGAVYLDIRKLGHDISGTTCTHGRGPNRKVQRISIVLNDDLLQQATSRDIIANLIHHMIHAYFLVACGPQDEKEVAYGRLSHGLHFGKIANTIKTLSGAYGKPLPIGFGHPLPYRSYYDEYHPRPPPRHPPKWFRSYCFSDVPVIPEADIEDFYRSACAPLLDLPETVQKPTVLIYNHRRHNLEQVHRASDLATPSTDSVEFLFDDKPVQISGDLIDNYLCVRRAFDCGKTRFLKVPEEVSKETFMTLLELLHTDNYSPDIQPVTASGKNGPPIIEAVHEDSPPYLLTDIRLFKAAGEMCFDDVKGVALDRLRAQYITHEDPITVLKALYEGGEPDPELRDWGRKFLTRAAGDEEFAGITRIKRYGADPPNIVKLEQDLSFRERFFDLVPRCGALEIDVLKARESLMRDGRMSPSWGSVVPRTYSPSVGMGMAGPLGLAPAMGMPQRYLTDEMERFGGYDGFRQEPMVVGPVRFGFERVGPGFAERFEDERWLY